MTREEIETQIAMAKQRMEQLQQEIVERGQKLLVADGVLQAFQYMLAKLDEPEVKNG